MLSSRLRSIVADVQQLASSANALTNLGLADTQSGEVLDAFMHGIRVVFIFYAPIIGVCALGALFVKDHGVAEKDASTSLRVEKGR